MVARKSAPEPEAAGRSPLSAALLDYYRHPGKYSTALREPAVLFGSIRAILQLAAGKAAGDEGGASVQRAAAFFVRFAVIFPGADHYTLLGVTRASDAATIKDHYRLMMRLVHPDFSGGPASAAWPSDTATRINLAYEVLRSPERRAKYEESFAPPPAVATRAAPPASAPPATAKPAAAEPRVLVKYLAAGFGALGALGVFALVVASHGEHDSQSLIQKERPTRASAPERPSTQIAPAPSVQIAASPPSLPPPPSSTSPLSPPSRAVALPLAPQRQPAPPAPAPGLAFLPSIVATAIAPSVIAAPPQAAPPAPAPVAAPAAVAVAVAVPAPPPAPPPPAAAQVPATIPVTEINPKLNPGLTLAQAQPMLAMLLQQLESGRGERLLNLLERDARNAPAARALARHFDGLVDGAYPVKLAKVEFRAEPADGRLFVVGHVRLQTGDASVAPKPLALRIEFRSRDGAVVMTGLSALTEN